MEPFLSEERLRLLRLIDEGERNGERLLASDLAARLSLAGRTSVAPTLARLERDGYLARRGGGRERRECVYRLTALGESILPQRPARLRLPVLGVIRAGQLAEAIQECEEWIETGDALDAQPGDVFLTVKGDSMTGDGIHQGDRVLLRPGLVADGGKIAAVQIMTAPGEYEATLKHVFLKPRENQVRLHASNPRYEDIIVSAGQIEIVGVYRGLIRPFA